MPVSSIVYTSVPVTSIHVLSVYYRRCLLVDIAGAYPGGGSEGSGPTPAPAHGRFYAYILNNIDVVITIIYSQKYVQLSCFLG